MEGQHLQLAPSFPAKTNTAFVRAALKVGRPINALVKMVAPGSVGIVAMTKEYTKEWSLPAGMYRISVKNALVTDIALFLEEQMEEKKDCNLLFWAETYMLIAE